MRDVTLKEVKIAAKHSLLATVRCSMRHHLYHCFVKGLKNVKIYSDRCALCKRAKFLHTMPDGKLCPLRDNDINCCKEWEALKDAKENDDLNAFHIAAARLYTRLALIEYKLTRKNK